MTARTGVTAVIETIAGTVMTAGTGTKAETGTTAETETIVGTERQLEAV
jgi:hypothetical protein